MRVYYYHKDILCENRENREVVATDNYSKDEKQRRIDTVIIISSICTCELVQHTYSVVSQGPVQRNKQGSQQRITNLY